MLQTQIKSELNTRVAVKDPFLLIQDVAKIYPTAKGTYTVLEDVNLVVNQSEFICLIGHSGCGKSTLLNMIAGFSQPSKGIVELKGEPITKPGPDRMMVFQNYALLPWKSAFENVYLAVNSVYPHKSKAEKVSIVNENLAMVGLADAADKKPQQLSGGMRQRVSIARALSIRPEILILDEPFGALDQITKEELQEELMKICGEQKCTVLMITHDIDEALFIPFDRPRDRDQIMEDPEYYNLRNYALDFLYHRFAHDDE
jgi:bicarbonate transport system ATP-binding protein